MYAVHLGIPLHPQRAARRRRRLGVAFALAAALAASVLAPTAAGAKKPPPTTTTTTRRATTTTTRPVTTTTTAVAPTTTTTAAPPTSTCPIAPANDPTAITTAIRNCPDGTATAPTLVRFPAGTSYMVANRIEVNRRNYVTIDLNGSTIRNTHDNNDVSGVFPNFFVLEGFHVTITNGTLMGNFADCGPRNLATLCGISNGVQGNAGVSFYGGRYVEASYLTVSEVMGDGIQTGPAWMMDPAVPHPQGWVEDLNVHHNVITTAARHCLSASGGVRVTLADNELNDCWYGAVDLEIDTAGTALRDAKVLRNKLNGFNIFGISVPAFGATGDVDGVEIRSNNFVTPQDQCSWAIQVNYWRVADVWAYDLTVAENTIRYRGTGVTAAWIDGGGITDNDLILTPGCGNAPIDVTGSRNLLVSGNTAA